MRLGSRQRGAALMVMLLIVVMGGAWWLVTGLAAYGNRTAVARAHNAKVLSEAKAALLAYVALQAASDDSPGRLPCPEGAGWIGVADAEGIAAPGVQAGVSVPNCSSVGRLPWRTLGIDRLQDADGEPLWFVVSTGSSGWALSSTTTTLSINANKAGTFAIDGNAGAAVAVIIAPGAPLNVAPNSNQLVVGCAARAQARTPSAPNYLDYLECQNIAGSSLRTTVTDNTSNPVFNDQVAVVTAAEIMAAIEPVVAQRILKTVVPEIKAVYADAKWNTSTANPAFAFAATYASDATGSDFKGISGKTDGFLPLNALTCDTLSTGRCDPNFHTWSTSSVLLTHTGGTAEAFSSNCTTSTTTQVRCTMSFSRSCGSLCFGVTANVSIRADGANVGMALRTLSTSAPSGLTSTTLTASLQTDGSARTTYAGQARNSTICGDWIGIACTGTATATIPISVFQDHDFLSPAATDKWYWFLANNWHHVTYYAVAPLHAPGGAGSCSGTTCISVTVYGSQSLSDQRAVLALAGHSLKGTIGSTRALSDFLDGTENTNLDLKFEQYRGNRSVNDRFVSLNP